MKKIKLNGEELNILDAILVTHFVAAGVFSLVFLILIHISMISSTLMMNDVIDGVSYVLTFNTSGLTVLMVIIALETLLLKLSRRIPAYFLKELGLHKTSKWLDSLYKDIDTSLEKFEEDVLESLTDGINQTIK